MKVSTALGLAGMQLAAALLAAAGVRMGYWEQGVAVRITMVAIGVMLLFNANSVSKVVSRSARFLAFKRILGWSMALGALAWIGIWLFAPIEIASLAAVTAVAGSILAAVAYGLVARPRSAA
jgi:hypothetical protein